MSDPPHGQIVSGMAVLDDLSGVEFEDMEDVFRTLGYETVRQATRTADEATRQT